MHALSISHTIYRQKITEVKMKIQLGRDLSSYMPNLVDNKNYTCESIDFINFIRDTIIKLYHLFYSCKLHNLHQLSMQTSMITSSRFYN